MPGTATGIRREGMNEKAIVKNLIITASVKAGQQKEGVEKGPEHLLCHCHTLNNDLPIENVTIVKLDEKQDSQKMETEAETMFIERNSQTAIWKPRVVSEFNRRLHHQIYEIGLKQLESEGNLPRILVLGGDHCLAIGSISAISRLCSTALQEATRAGQSLPFKKPELLIVWVDAHADINTPTSTSSGSLHGCPVSLLLGLDPEGWSQLKHFQWANKVLPFGANAFIDAKRLIYIGARDIEESEKKTLDSLNIKVVGMDQVNKADCRIQTILNAWLKQVDPKGEHPIHLSFDIDGIDPKFAPSTGTPVPNGLSPKEGQEIIRLLKSTNRLVSMDVVEVNPDLGSEEDQQLTLNTAKSIINQYWN